MPFATELGYGLLVFDLVFGFIGLMFLSLWFVTAFRSYTYNYLRRVRHVNHCVRFTKQGSFDTVWRIRSFNNVLMIFLMVLETLAHTSVYINFSEESVAADVIFNSFNMRFQSSVSV
jgi:hypothetical protein